MKKSEVISRIKGLKGEQRKATICALIGHSNIVTTCFGYVGCGRCKAQIGDTLAGCYSNEKAVIVGHDCKVCRKNFKRLTWQDLLEAPKNVFSQKKRAPIS